MEYNMLITEVDPERTTPEDLTGRSVLRELHESVLRNQADEIHTKADIGNKCQRTVYPRGKEKCDQSRLKGNFGWEWHPEAKQSIKIDCITFEVFQLLSVISAQWELL